METLPRVNGWKLMTTGDTARAQVFDSCPLTLMVCTMHYCERMAQISGDVGDRILKHPQGV